MYTRNVSEILHVGWPDPDWIRGFSVVVRPLVEIDPEALQESMTTEEVPGLEPLLARNNFDTTRISQLSDRSELTIVRDTLHCGTLGSEMHRRALASMNFRLDLLLSES